MSCFMAPHFVSRLHTSHFVPLARLCLLEWSAMHCQNATLCWPLLQTRSWEIKRKLKTSWRSLSTQEFFPFLHFTCKEVGSNVAIVARRTRDGVRFCNRQNMIFSWVLEVFFSAWPFRLLLVSTIGVCHSTFDPQPNLNYCSDPFTEHCWRCSKRVFGMVEECRRTNEMSQKELGYWRFCSVVRHM